jgi:hypothetical protein
MVGNFGLTIRVTDRSTYPETNFARHASNSTVVSIDDAAMGPGWGGPLRKPDGAAWNRLPLYGADSLLVGLFRVVA